ncbi:MAG: 50S ribosomal protein L21 [Parcubacteria group bacterium]|nr:50S ribosomal protein L21 [Parcubacteria group bacterium]
MSQFAVIKSGGKQYKVAEGETIKLEKLDTSKGEEVVFSDVLLVSNDIGLKLGSPKIEGAKVSAKVVKNGRTRKVIVFKYRAKKRRKKKAGHRQHFTEVQITKISA